MQALSDDQRIDALAAKVDAGFERMDKGFQEMRADVVKVRDELRGMRQDLCQVQTQATIWGVAILAMWLTLILGFAGIVVALIT